ncbi:MAG: menaquinol oxidoreductase [Spirochaetes bacterium]|nr:MAG: menaquinol oxidoreductase [Spirochaetota bacterium]
MMIAFAITVVSAIAFAAWIGAGQGLQSVMGIALPYAGLSLFLAGMLYRVIRWVKTPVPFNISVTCGQQRSLPWVRPEPLDNPHNSLYTSARMLVETFLFRSLFRNTRAGRNGAVIVYGSDKWLWLGSMAFHWMLLVISVRHLRLFIEPVPAWIDAFQQVDGIFSLGLPPLLISNVIIAAALAYLFMRRVVNRKIASLSLFQDYFLLALVAAVVLSGMYVRYFGRVDLLAVKQFAIGLLSFQPVLPAGAAPFFYMHVVLVSVLAAAIPASKIVHLAGIFFSPTRNSAADSRRRRHVNPWNPPVAVHTYEEWEDEFRDRLVKSGYAVERDEHG